MSNVESKLKTILLEKYEISIETLEEHKNKQNFLFEIDLDSLDTLALSFDIEKEFGIDHIDEEEYRSYSFSEMVKAIETHNINGNKSNFNKSNSRARKNKQEVPVFEQILKSNLNIHEDKRTAVVLKPEAKEHTNKPTIKHPGFCITVKNQPFCKLMERPCYMPKQENNTDKPYCDFIKCKLYENVNKLR